MQIIFLRPFSITLCSSTAARNHASKNKLEEEIFILTAGVHIKSKRIFLRLVLSLRPRRVGANHQTLSNSG